MTGTVRYWNDSRGFGFIDPDAGGASVFLHYTDLQGDRYLMLKGRAVEFDVTPYSEGVKATNVRFL